MGEYIMLKDKRCVHLDFHTSEKIRGIGSHFDKQEFVAALKEANLDSITLFAKCHHGNFYYPSEKFFTHPYLTRPLLDEQVEACKEAGVSAKIYISAGLDEHLAMSHPEWLRVRADGTQPNLLKPQWKGLCFNTPYLDVLAEQTVEVMNRYMPDGIFYDIVGIDACTCPACMRDMAEKGLDYRKEEDLWKQGRDVFDKFTKRLIDTVRSIKSDTLIFFNAGNFLGHEEYMNVCDQLEAESLPTGGWGYDHFPLTMSYIRRQGKNCIGMTGKFHTHWGDMGSFKYKDALLYEGAQCLAFDAGLSVGDQMHPSGRIDWYTYENVGNTMRYLEERDQWRGGEFLPEFALLSTDPFWQGQGRTGAGRLFFEAKYLFDLILPDEISNKYPVIVLTDDCELSDEIYALLKKYVNGGGKILAVGKSPLYKGEMAFDLGARFIGEDKYNPTYFKPRYDIAVASNLPLMISSKAYDIEATGEVLADKISPYFQREGLNFCSHLHTPCDYDKVAAGITKGKDGIYIAVDLFIEYAKTGTLNAKQMMLPLIESLLGAENKTVRTNLPSSGKVALYRREEGYILHLLYANTIKRGEGIEVIEDLVTIADITVSLKLDTEVTSAVCRPSGKVLPLALEADGRVTITLDKLHCYEIIELK